MNKGLIAAGLLLLGGLLFAQDAHIKELSGTVVGGLAELSVPPASGSFAELSVPLASGSFAENQTQDLYTNFAAGGGVDWEAPGALQDMVQVEVSWSSGAVNDRVIAFSPITSIAQGEVFRPKLSGLMAVKGKYTARPYRTVSASAALNYFIRTDGVTLTGEDYPPSSSRLMGGELYGTLLWAPVEDLMLTLGGGAFFPAWGDVFAPDAPVRWKAAVGFIFSL
jgi:hypothetical protein